MTRLPFYRAVPVACAAVFLVLLLAAYDRRTGQLPGILVKVLLHRIALPPHFKLELYASGIPNARSLALGPDGIVFVGSRKAGKVYALLDHDHRNRADEVVIIARHLNTPNGIAFHDGALFVAENVSFAMTT